MAARTSVQRRAPARPSGLSSPRLALSIEDWESNCPLGEVELKSVELIQNVSSEVPLPLKFDASEQRSESPLPGKHARFKTNSRPATPVASTSSNTLHPSQPIQTPQQFYDWLDLIDRAGAHNQESHFRAHVAEVKSYLDACDDLAGQIDQVENEIGSMYDNWTSVEEGGRSLQDACERLLQERDKLQATTEAIGERLEYFEELDHATRMLNHPGDGLVLQLDFLSMIERVDICIDYLKVHRHFKEAEVYLLRFQQCMTRAMTLIKIFFIGALRIMVQDISKRLSEKGVSSHAQMLLLYSRFASAASQLSPLLRELERRSRTYPNELDALLSECQYAFLSARKTLLLSRLQQDIKGLNPTNTELVELTREGCSYLKQLCTEEFNVYKIFFTTGEEKLYSYLENLCDYLYDDLRPRILHEPRLAALCEVCTVLQALMVLDVPLSLKSEDDGDTAETLDEEISNTGQAHKGVTNGKLHISQLLELVLQDAQTRLFFKAQSVIQSDIKYFVATPQDLNYPEKLILARKPLSNGAIREKGPANQLFQMPSLDKQETWYPTLQKTVWVLSQLHNFVQPAIFEDIAQEAVSLCKQSLVTASESLRAQNPAANGLDAQLFLLRHLLILKEITQNLNYVHRDTPPSVDLTRVTDALSAILGRTTSLIPTSFLASIGMPLVGETRFVEAKLGVDQQLKITCEDIIFGSSEYICAPLRDWVNKITSQAKPSDGLKPESDSKEGAPQSSAEVLVANFHEALERDLRSSVSRMRLYLEDERTVNVLLGHIQDRIGDEYTRFREVVWNMYDGVLRDRLLSPIGLKTNMASICGEGTSQLNMTGSSTA